MTNETQQTGDPAPDSLPLVGAQGAKDPDGGSTRRCIASGESLPVADLIRFVVGPDDSIVPDVNGRLPGRGLWLRARRDMIETAAQKRLFAKAARANVNVTPDLADTVAELLRRRCLNHLGLAQRAGLVASGAEKVRAQIATGHTAALLEASDGSAAERQKMCALASSVPVVDVFTSVELGGALGRETTVHVALLPGRLTETILQDAGRYRGLLS